MLTLGWGGRASGDLTYQMMFDDATLLATARASRQPGEVIVTLDGARRTARLPAGVKIQTLIDPARSPAIMEARPEFFLSMPRNFSTNMNGVSNGYRNCFKRVGYRNA